MFNPKRPEDLQAMLLAMAAAGAQAPEGRARVARWLRAALALVEDEEVSTPEIRITPAMARALEEVAASLNTAAEKAEFLAEKAAVTGQPRP